MKITGELLKAGRINKNLSVQDVAQALKLSPKLITALEAGNTDELPAKTFVRGFVKSYAQLLKLDSSQVLRQFQEEMGSTVPMPKIPPPPPQPNPSEVIKAPKPALKQTSQSYSGKTPTMQPASLSTDNSKNILYLISGALVLIVVLIVSSKIIDSFKPDPVAVTSTTPEIESTPVASADNAVAAVTAPTQTSAVNASSDTSEDVSPLEGFTASTEKPVEILLEAKKEIEIFYAKGNSKTFTPIKLNANQIQILRSNNGLYLKSSDGGAFKISVNGLETGVAGAPNKPVKLTF